MARARLPILGQLCCEERWKQRGTARDGVGTAVAADLLAILALWADCRTAGLSLAARAVAEIRPINVAEGTTPARGGRRNPALPSVPILGPSTARDGVGTAVDLLFDPLFWLLEPLPKFGLNVAEGTTRRETLIEPLDDLKAGSVDYYSALRSAYYQGRAVELRKGRDGR